MTQIHTRDGQPAASLAALARTHALMSERDAALREIQTVLDGLSRLKMTQHAKAA